MLHCYPRVGLQSRLPLVLLVAKELAEMSAVPPHWPNTLLDLAKRREGGLRRRVVLDLLLQVLTWQDLGYFYCITNELDTLLSLSLANDSVSIIDVGYETLWKMIAEQSQHHLSSSALFPFFYAARPASHQHATTDPRIYFRGARKWELEPVNAIS
jgi:hypothetical protein